MTVSLSFYPFVDSFTWRLLLRLKRKVIDNDCYIDLYFCSINITQCRNFSNKVWNVGIRQKQCKKTYFSTNHSSFLNEQRIENGKINLSPISSLSITYLAEPFQYSSCGSGHCPLAGSLSLSLRSHNNGLHTTRGSFSCTRRNKASPTQILKCRGNLKSVFWKVQWTVKNSTIQPFPARSHGKGLEPILFPIHRAGAFLHTLADLRPLFMFEIKLPTDVLRKNNYLELEMFPLPRPGSGRYKWYHHLGWGEVTTINN